MHVKKLKMQVLKQSTTSPMQSNNSHHSKGKSNNSNPLQSGNKTSHRTESNRNDAGSIIMTGGGANNQTARDVGMIMSSNSNYDQEPQSDGIMRLNSLQVSSNHANERLLDPTSLHQNLKLQLTAQNAADLSDMTAVGAEDELLSPQTSANQCETTTLFSAQPGGQQEEPGTFEMGYITFFPKNQNDNFQTIPEQQAPVECKPADQQTATNGWTSEQRPQQANKQQSQQKGTIEPPNTKPKQPKSPSSKRKSDNSAAGISSGTTNGTSKLIQLSSSTSTQQQKQQMQMMTTVRKIDSINVTQGGDSQLNVQSNTQSAKKSTKSSSSNNTTTMLPRRKIQFLQSENGGKANNSVNDRQNQPPQQIIKQYTNMVNTTNESDRSSAASRTQHISSDSINQAQQKRKLQVPAAQAQDMLQSTSKRQSLKKKRPPPNDQQQTMISSAGRVGEDDIIEEDFGIGDDNGINSPGNNLQQVADNLNQMSMLMMNNNSSAQHQQLQDTSGQDFITSNDRVGAHVVDRQLFVEQQAEKILAKKEVRMNSEPARKSRRTTGAIGINGNYKHTAGENHNNSLNLKPNMQLNNHQQRRTVSKDTTGAAAATLKMLNETTQSNNKTGRNKNTQQLQQQMHQGQSLPTHQVTVKSQFHPNASGVVDTNVVSFMTEKPGTSDINQPSNRKIKINRKLQRNGTTDTGTFRSSYYNKIRNDAATIIDPDLQAQQLINMTHDGRHNYQQVVSDDRNGVMATNNANCNQSISVSQNYYEPTPNVGQDRHSSHAVPQLQSVDSPKHTSVGGVRRQLEQQVLSTGKPTRRAQHRHGPNTSTIEGFESVNASALSNERLRMQTVNTQATQESASQYQLGPNLNYGIRSNISEINEAADFSTNLRSDYSISSPKNIVTSTPATTTRDQQLPSIHNTTPQNESIMLGAGRNNFSQQKQPPTTSYSTTASTSQKHQKRYGGYGRTTAQQHVQHQQQQQQMALGDMADATTMASYLESSTNNHNQQYQQSNISTTTSNNQKQQQQQYHQVASKFSTYDDTSKNNPNASSVVSTYNNPGMQFNYSTTEPNSHQQSSSSTVQKQQKQLASHGSKSQPPAGSHKKVASQQQQAVAALKGHHQLNQQIALYTHQSVDPPASSQRGTINGDMSPTPLQHTKSPAMMYYPTHGGGATTPSVTENPGVNGAGGPSSLDYKDILDERFASPRVLVKQSQPLLSKNQFISYLNESTQDMPLSPKRRQHLKQFSSSSNAPQQMISQSVTPMVSVSGHPSYIEKFQAMQQVMQGASTTNNARSQHMTAVETTGGGTTYQNMRADEIIKKYHSSNTDVQRARAGGNLTGTVSPRQIDFGDRNIGTAVGNLNNLNGSFVSDTLMASANMSIGSSRQQANRGAVMENMLQKIRNAVSPTGGPPNLDGPGGQSSSYLTSPRATAQLTPLLNQSVLSANNGGDPSTSQFDQRQDVGSRQSQVCRQVIEEFAQKYSTTIDKKRGSINPRRQNPIVKQPVSKRQASRAADCQLSPRLPDCFLYGPASTQAANTNGAGANVANLQQQNYDNSCGQNSSLAISHSPVARRSQHQYNPSSQNQKNSQLSHISSSALPSKTIQQYHLSGGVHLGGGHQPQHAALVSTGNSILQNFTAPQSSTAANATGGSEMQQLSLMQRGAGGSGTDRKNAATAAVLMDHSQ